MLGLQLAQLASGVNRELTTVTVLVLILSKCSLSAAGPARALSNGLNFKFAARTSRPAALMSDDREPSAAEESPSSEDASAAAEGEGAAPGDGEGAVEETAGAGEEAAAEEAMTTAEKFASKTALVVVEREHVALMADGTEKEAALVKLKAPPKATTHAGSCCLPDQ